VLEEAGIDGESLTWLVVTGATREEVAAALSVVLGTPTDSWMEDGAAWALAELPGGVLALEHSGYADPSNDSLVALSRDGRSVAVARSNIQAHERFGCARDGELVFDDDEWAFIDDPSRVPAELRPLFDTGWIDPAEEDDADDGGWDGVPVALAMCEVWTGLAFTSEDVRRVIESGYYAGPALVSTRE
jgi:hypothetical protein